MVLLKNFKNIFFIPELMRKLLVTLGIMIVYRIGVFIPVIGLNIRMLHSYMDQMKAGGGMFAYLDMFSGGALQRGTIFALGISPYITSSIIMQMLGLSVPYFEQLQKEGEFGRRKLNQYTRYLAILLSFFYSFGYAVFLEKNGLVLAPGVGFKVLFVMTLTFGSVFVMWLGEQISLFGLGNGSSMLIFAGIVASFWTNFVKTWTAVFTQESLSGMAAILVLLFFLVLVACIVFLEKGDRRIPVQYARRIVGQRVYGGQSTYIPFKINVAGVMPVIFAGSFLNILMFATAFLAQFELLKFLKTAFEFNGYLYNVAEFGLIVFFTYFYTAVIYNPTELADNMKKSGGFIPGIRPGKQTADFFDYLLNRLGLIGAIYLAGLAIVPNIAYGYFKLPFYLGGTSLLIVAGVAMETAAQIEAYLLEHRYEGFLTTGRVARLRGKAAR